MIRDLYESDNYARVALQTIDEDSKRLFLVKNASVLSKIDFLKSKDLIAEETLLDTLKYYLKDKEENVLNLRKLQQNSEESPIGDVLQKIKNLEAIPHADAIEKAAQSLIKIRDDLKAEGTRIPDILVVICGLSNFAYQREDGVYVVPITALRP